MSQVLPPFGRKLLPDTHLSNDHVFPKMADQVSSHHQLQIFFGQQGKGCTQQAETQVANKNRAWSELPFLEQTTGQVPPR
jgi:hypothetical protein